MANFFSQFDDKPASERNFFEQFSDEQYQPRAEGGDFVAGAKAGWESLKSLAYGAKAAFGQAIGDEEIQQSGIEKMQAYEEQAGEYGRGRITRYEDVKGVGDFVDYAQYTLGQLTPFALESAATAIAGAVAGSAAAPGVGTAAGAVAGLTAKTAVKEAIKRYVRGEVIDEAEKAVAKNALAKAGGTIGAVMGSYPVAVGDVYNETVEAGDPSAGTAFAAAIPYTALDVIPEVRGLRKVLDGTKGGIISRVAKNAVTQAPMEAAAETGQEEILIQTRGALDTTYDTTGKEANSRRLNSAVAGALGGAAFGGVAGLSRAEDAPTTDDETRTDAVNVNRIMASGSVDDALAAATAAAESKPLDPYAQTLAEQNAARQAQIDAAGIVDKPTYGVSPRLRAETPQAGSAPITAGRGVAGRPAAPAPAQTLPESPAAPSGALPNLPPDPMVVFKDGTVARKGEVEAEIARLETAGQTEDAANLRARLIGYSGGQPSSTTETQIDQAAPAESIAYHDPRLKREAFRAAALDLVRRDMTPGGGISIVPDLNYKTGESGKRGEVPKIRTSSVHQPWIQSLLADNSISVEKVRAAVEKAVTGQSLGKRQQRVVTAILDQITGERFVVPLPKMFGGDTAYRANAAASAPAGSRVVSSEIIVKKIPIKKRDQKEYGLPEAVYAWRVSVIENEDGSRYSQVEAMTRDYGRTPGGEIVGYFDPVDSEAISSIAPSIDKAAFAAFGKTSPANSAPAAQTDLLGEVPVNEQALADAKREKDAKRNGRRDVPMDAAPGTLFNQGQRDIEDAKPEPATATKEEESIEVRRARMDLDAALADLGSILLDRNTLKVVPIDEVKLIPVLTRVMDAAFRLGYHKFKDSARFVLKTIREKFGNDAADAVTLDHLQGAYIGMAGKYPEADTKRAVVDVDSLDEIQAPEATTEEQGNDSRTGGTGAEALGGMAPAEDRAPESGGDVHAGDAEGGGESGDGNQELDEQRGAAPRGPGNRAPRVHSAEARTGRGGKSGRKGGKRGGGTGVSGYDETDDASGRVDQPNIPAANFVIDEELRLGKGGEVEKFRDNIAAIKTLKQIQAEQRRATPEEQRILARYVGWGGLANAFADDKGGFKDGWEARSKELAELLADRELAAARASTRNAHYTSESVVRGMWDAVRHLGYRGGLALEPSAGTGNFIGMAPADLRNKFIAVEYDAITAGIAHALYPQATVLHSGFQRVPLAYGAFDLVIGNPPFGNESLNFQFKPEFNRKSIHNQFFLAGLDALKPGGIMPMVVSRYLLDAKDSEARIEMAKRGRLLGAIRLPDTAFKENARTEVVTDILFFQRYTAAEQAEIEQAFEQRGRQPSRGETENQRIERERLAALIPDWIDTTSLPDPLGGDAMTVNRYFAANPRMVLGTLERSGSMRYGADITVRLDKGEDIGAYLARAIARLPRNVVNQTDEAIAASIERHKSMADALEIALSGAEEGAVTRDLDGGMTQVVEKETPEGGYELSRRKLTPESPWSTQLYMDSKGRWFREVQKLDADGKAVKNGRFNVYERDVFETEADVPSHLRLGEARFELLAQLVEMRDLLKQQLILETEDAPSKKIEENRKLLAKAYQDFVDKRGPINADRNAKLVSDMPDGALVLALEMSYRKEQKEWTGKMLGKTKVYKTVRPESATPAPILKERVARPYEPPTRAESPADALGVSLAETGRINMARVADLLGKTEDEAIAELFESADEPLIFKDPETEQWETRDVYLTGHVRRKLHAARAAGLSKHIAALGKVQPDPIGAENITPNIGMSWIPADIYADFLHHLTGERTRVHYSAITNAYSVTGTGLTKQAKEWGTDRTTAFDLVDDILNSRQTRVYDRDSDGKQHLNQEQTDLANLKREQIAVEFSDWVFQQSERRNRLVDIFNEKFNTRVARQHNGSHLTFPGKVPDLVIQMHRHQKNAIWRGISERFTLYDHAVGAGKTYTAIARAMERRRMGLSRKPMIVVPNHMVEQFGADVYRLYPGAKVLAAGKKDFERKNRRKLFAKIATGDWDVVIVPHSSFERIQIAPETEERYLQTEIALAEKAIKEAEEQAAEDGNAGRRKPFNVKEAERVKASLEARLEKLKTRNKDRLLTFEQMGVDDLTVDEAHEFKNLFYNSRLTGVRGMGTKTGSQRAFDLYSKVRVLRDSPTGTVTFMTGTPISNSAVEMYTMMRYLAANELAELGLDHFDAWRAQFVGIKTKYEPTESGGLKEVNRLGRDWANMRSLMDLYYSFTDAVTNEDIKNAFAEDNPGQEFPLPKVKGGGRQSIVVKPTKAQESILQTVINGFDNLPNIRDPNEQNSARLRLMDRARKLSLDARAVDPHSTSDEKGGKLDMVADRVAAIYKDWAKHRGTQLIFLDRSVPKGKNDHKIIREYDGLVAERDKALADGDEEAFRKAEDKLEKFDPNEVDEMRNAQRGGWNAYKQIKENLIARGLKAEEVRFIQEANTDEQKQALFDAVNDGEIRVLIGSTPRMGAGTNVQQRLVALHHVDVTWKPSDIEQREGRIIRQGNKLYEQFTKKGDDFFVEINAYVTERTVDAKMWDLNATKLKMINAIRSYDGSFNMEFEDEDSVSMAEIAALATGNPLMMERIVLMGAIDKLSLLERQHKRKQWGIKDSIRQAEKDVADLPAKIEQKKADAKRFAKAIEAAETESGARRVTVEGAEYESAFDAETAAMDAIKAQQDGNENAKYAVSVNGSRLTNKADITKAIKTAIGDRGFVATINSKPYTEILEASRPIAEAATRMANDLLPGQAAQTETMGTLYGLNLELDANRSDYSKNFIFTLSLTDETGRVIVSDQLNPYEHPKPAPASFKNALSGLAQELKGITRPYDYQWLEQRLAEAQEDLPKLREKENAQFDRADELTAKRARLQEVTSTLAAKAAPDGAPVGGAPVGGASGPVLSTAQELPEANWISAGETAQVVEEFATKFRHEVPVIVEDRPADVLGAAAGADDAAGMVWNGRVYVFRSGIPDRAELVSTLFHEFLHYGVRRFIPRQQYINTMRQLYEADAWIQDKTMDWVESPEGRALLAEGEERAYVVARGVDEALAELAEQIEGNPASFRHNGFMAKTIRAVSRWMAKVARRLGFTEAAARWEAVTNDEARRFIGRIFTKLQEDAPGVDGIETTDTTFRKRQPAAPQTVADIDTTLFDEFRFKAQDRFHYLNKLQKAAAAERGIEELPEGEDAYLAELRYHGMAGAAIEDFQREHVDPLLEVISQSGLSVDDVDLYLQARHAEEANAQLARINPDREDNQALSGMSNEEAYDILKRLDSPAMRDIGDRVDAITKARRDKLVESGLETRETVDAWESTYQHYVPLKREGFDGRLPSKGMGFNTRGKEKRRAGSNREVVHVLANVVAQYEATAIKAEKVKVGKAFLEFARNNANPDLYEVDKVEYKPTFDAEGLVTYRGDRGFIMADNVLVVRVDGVDHRITFNNQSPVAMRIAHAMNNLGATESGPIVNTLSKLTRWLAIVNTGANPEFVISNFARDLQTAGYNLSATAADKLKWKIIKDVGKSWRGIRSFQKQDGKHHEWAQYFDEFRKAGAQTGWLQSYSSIEDREQALIQKIRDMGRDTTGLKVKAGLTAVIEFIENENTAVENAIRLSAFVHARRAGMTEAQAAKIAKEMTVNFNRKGDMGQVLNALYLFYNASIQGSVRLLQAVAKSRKVQIMAGATVIFAAVLDMINRSLGGDDDDGEAKYDKISDFVKERNLIIMLPSGGGDYIKIPLPWGYNVLHVMGQGVGEAMTQRGFRPGKSAMRVAASAVSAFNPIGGSESLLQFLSPTITDPLVQWAENKDWAGKPLRPASNPFGVDTPNSQKYWNSVRAPSKWLTDTLNELTGGDEVRPGAVDVSPEAIDLLIDTFTGGAGRFLSDIVSTPAKALSDEPIESYEVPLLRKVYGAPGMGTVVSDFYERMEAVQVTDKQLKHYKGDSAKIAEIRRQHPGEVRLLMDMKLAQSQLRKVRKQIKLYEKSGNESALKIARERENEIMRRFNRAYNNKMGRFAEAS